MGRQKTYDRDEVLTDAMNTFWENGFHNTSTRELAAAMGLNVATLYTEFGSKEGLYSASLEQYERDVVGAFFGPLEAPDASLDTVRATLRLFPAMAQKVAAAPGCLVTNAAVERAPDAAASADVMARYVARIAAGIGRALMNTHAPAESDSAAVARFSHHLVAVLLGMFVMSRAHIDATVLHDVAESAVDQLNSFAAQHGLV